MANRNIGTRVKVKAIQGAGDFAGRTGYVGGIEYYYNVVMYRVYFDKPVKVTGLDYEVTDDLFAGSYLTTIRKGE